MKKIFVFLFCLQALNSFAQSSGSIDTTFHAGYYANADVFCTAVQADGKILLGGKFVTFNNEHVNKIVRLNPDFSIDPTFNLPDAPDFSIYSLLVMPDGKIMMGGNFVYIGDYEYHHIARLNMDGTIDITFNPGTGIGPLPGLEEYSSRIEQMILQPDGKILIMGNFNEYDGEPRGAIARIYASGSLDLTFTPPVAGYYYTMELAPDGKIFVAYGSLKKLNSDGTLDAGFPTVSVSAIIEDIALLADGSILIAGDISNVGGYIKYELAKLNPDGTLDFSFFPDPVALSIQNIILKDDGKIMTFGYNYIEQFNADGTPDISFPAKPINAYTYEVAETPSNYIMVGNFTGYNSSSVNRVAAILSDGSLDPSVHNQAGGIPGYYTGKALEKMGEEIYLGGDFNSFDGLTKYNLVRIKEFGGIDPTYVSPYSGILTSSGAVNDILAVESGKLLIGGSYSSSSNKLYRINHDGSIDATLNTGSGFGTSDIIYSLGLESDGKYAVGGYINTYNGTSRTELIRILSNGTYDANFTFCCAAYNIYSVAYQYDQKILVGGTFSGSSSYKYFTRGLTTFLNDADYIPSSYTGANASVYKIIYNPADSGSYIFGDFTLVNTTSRIRACKLKQDGSVDMTFNPGTGANAIVRSAALLPDGRILIGGDFTIYNGVTANHIACLLPDGTLDPDFISGYGTDGSVYDILVYDAYAALICGNFSYYNTSTSDGLARIFYNAPLCFDVASEINDVICDGSNYTLIDGTIVTLPGTYVATGVTALSCDSTVTYHLTASPIYNQYQSVVIPAGSTYTLPDGVIVNSAGTYISVLSTIYGCDSVINTIVTVTDACSYPAGITALMITSSSAKISWSAAAGATKYQLQYRPSAGGAWLKKNVTGTSKVLTGLSPSTMYQYKVKTICAAGSSGFSPIQTFTTLPLKYGMENNIDFEIYPNPNQGTFTISINASEYKPFTIQIINAVGQKINEYNTTAAQFNLNEKLAPGIYYISITDGIIESSKKLIIIN